MTVASFGARALVRHLQRDASLADTRGYYRALARELALPWLLSSSEDLRYPTSVGRRPFWLGWLQAYAGQVFALTGYDARAYSLFLGRMHMLQGPAIM